MKMTCKLCDREFDETEFLDAQEHDPRYTGDLCPACHIRSTPKLRTFCPISGAKCSGDCGWFEEGHLDCNNRPRHGRCVLHCLRRI